MTMEQTDLEVEETEDLEKVAARVAKTAGGDPDSISSLSGGGKDDDEKIVSLLMLDPETARRAREARRPNIDWLEDAVAMVDGSPVPLFEVGDRLVIERRAGDVLRGSPWLDTQTYQVMHIDDETGNLRLWNRELCQHGWGNYITGPERGDVYKLAPNTKASFSKKKRGRPRKHPEKPAAVPLPDGEKKRRGRPKGTKNRPKDVIKEEKEARYASRRAKKGAGVVK
jgi:hypothetical protein